MGTPQKWYFGLSNHHTCSEFDYNRFPPLAILYTPNNCSVDKVRYLLASTLPRQLVWEQQIQATLPTHTHSQREQLAKPALPLQNPIPRVSHPVKDRPLLSVPGVNVPKNHHLRPRPRDFADQELTAQVLLI